MKLIEFKVAEISESSEKIILKFEPKAVLLANEADVEFYNVKEFQIKVKETNGEHYLITKDFDLMMAPCLYHNAPTVSFNIMSLAKIDTFKRLVLNEVIEYKKNRAGQDMTSLFICLEDMNKQHAIDLALDKRDFEALRKLVPQCK
ncbi:hypothetical protein JOD29_000793 [Lysinibacillus composti]|uniref:Uncharacterized protein n=1 Tax=Lysinibacillus composti TaxID=720633 RepID=A0A3N9UJ12_9BACI|nr:hypothetical protein [Lysinibacillus composti]MBM7607549.1 hypothetical protein [Lysinibacillus composti]RQW75945.1 hypothetical protein EBB45_04830 [Lysinibacillus composti]